MAYSVARRTGAATSKARRRCGHGRSRRIMASLSSSSSSVPGTGTAGSVTRSRRIQLPVHSAGPVRKRASALSSDAPPSQTSTVHVSSAAAGSGGPP